MPNYDERLTALEQTSVTGSDFITVYNKIAQDQSDTHHELTMLLGMLSGQGKDVRAIKERLGHIEQRLNHIDDRVSDTNQHLYTLEERFDKRFVSLEERFDKRFVSLETRFGSLETEVHSLRTGVNSLETRVNEHTTVLNQHTDLLTQILARLPEKP